MNKQVFIIPMIVAVLVILIAGGFWYFQKIQEKEKEQKILWEIEQKEQRSEKESQENKGRFSEGKIEEEYYLIPELGIKFRVKNEELRGDLVYYFKRETGGKFGVKYYETVFFSSRSLTEIAPSCSAKAGAFGAITKYQGTPRDYGLQEAFENRKGYQQFRDFFVYYVSPQSPCTNDPIAEELDANQSELFRRAIINKVEIIQ